MAAVVGEDAQGVYAIIECDRPECRCHVALRPAEGQSAYDTICAAFDIAEDEGWVLVGSAYCPLHVGDKRARTLGKMGEGYRWADVTHLAANGAQRPS